jgi:capsular polysaccharide biosynthesis protein
MLSPAQIKVWRKQIDVQPELGSFDGHHVASVKLELRQIVSDTVPEQLGTFYPPERIFGQPADPSCLRAIQTTAIVRPKGHAERIKKGRVIGFAAILSPDNRLYMPEEVGTNNAQVAVARNSSDHYGFLVNEAEDGLIARFVSRATPRSIKMDAFFVHSLELGNYGSFIFRQLPQMITARNLGLQFDCYIGERTPWFLEALRLVGLPPAPVFSPREISGETFNSVQFCTHSDAEAFLSPEAKAGLAELAKATQNHSSGKTGEKLYVSRALSTLSRPLYRPMLNEADIERIALRHGFHVIYPETCSFSEQIKAFSRATRVIGPSGSGMLNAAFAREGSRVVDLETYTVAVRQHAKLYASCGHHYAFAFSQPEESDSLPMFQRKWNLTEPLFLEALEWLSA